MGHVPAGSLPQACEGAHLPRRQRRGSRTPRTRAAHRRLVGDTGEAIAARFLERRGCTVLARNVRVGRGEIDLIVRHRGRVVAVEVKAGTDPDIHFTAEKVDAVRAAMARIDPPLRRLDLVTVVPMATGAIVKWVQAAG